MLQGFEPRNTEISNRLISYDNLLKDPDVESNMFGARPPEAIIQKEDNMLIYMDSVNDKTSRNSTRFLYKRARWKRKNPFFCEVPSKSSVYLFSVKMTLGSS